MELWAVRPFKFQWQNPEDEYLGPGLASISPQRKSKFRRKNNQNIAIFVILGSLTNNRRYVVVFLISMQLKERCTSLRLSKIINKMNASENNSEKFLVLDLLLSNGFKA